MTDQTQRTKQCGKCGEEKPLSQFSPHSACRDGVRGTCKTCASTYAKDWQRRKKTNLRGFIHVVMSAAKNRAKKAVMPFDLSIEYLLDLWAQQKGKCAVSGLPFSRTRSKWHRNPYAPSLDKITPHQGYVEGNVRFVLEAINVGLNEWGVQEILPIWDAAVKRSRTKRQDDGEAS